MPAPIRWSIHFIALLGCITLSYLIVTTREFPSFNIFTSSDLGNFKTLFLSIILEAIPFVLLGVLVSSLLQVFVSEQTIRRFIPKNPILGVLFGCLLGIIFPLCECGMIPIVRRLMLKGMPTYIATIFIIAGPILNPVVYASTYMAFRSRPELAYSRMGLAFMVAVIIGLLLYRFVTTNPLRVTSQMTRNAHEHHEHSHSEHDHSHDHDHHHYGTASRWGTSFAHASDEFFEMGKYLILGALLTAGIQSIVARESLIAIGQGEWSSHLFMMGFAYILSLCSTSDAFVASSFTTTFSAGSLLTFLVFGPMLDLKNTFMMLSVFRTRFVLLLSLLIIVTVLVGSILIEKFWFGVV